MELQRGLQARTDLQDSDLGSQTISQFNLHADEKNHLQRPGRVALLKQIMDI